MWECMVDRKQRNAWQKKIDAATSPKEQQKLIEQAAKAEAAEDMSNLRAGQKFDASGGARKVRGGDGGKSPEGPGRASARGNRN